MSAAQDAALELLVSESNNNPAWALTALARKYGFAVYYYDRECFEADLDRKLTEDEWARLQPELEDFDEWLSNSGASDSLSYWREMVLEKAQIEVES